MGIFVAFRFFERLEDVIDLFDCLLWKVWSLMMGWVCLSGVKLLLNALIVIPIVKSTERLTTTGSKCVVDCREFFNALIICIVVPCVTGSGMC